MYMSCLVDLYITLKRKSRQTNLCHKCYISIKVKDDQTRSPISSYLIDLMGAHTRALFLFLDQGLNFKSYRHDLSGHES